MSERLPAFVSEEEYLSTSYEPGVEYVHGRLEEPVMVQSVHGRLQSWLIKWFGRHEDEWGIDTAVEVHTRVAQGIYRLPDVIVDHAGPWDPVLKKPPLIAIEVLSPDDRHWKVLKKAREYSAMGIPNVWLIDPETRVVEVWRDNAFVIVTEMELRATEGPVYLDLKAMNLYLDKIQGPQG
jgi:Uma2 family endonuclease